jgi:hypothetical protein
MIHKITGRTVGDAKYVCTGKKAPRVDGSKERQVYYGAKNWKNTGHRHWSKVTCPDCLTVKESMEEFQFKAYPKGLIA